MNHSSGLNIALTLSIVWGIIALIAGALLISSADSIANTVMDTVSTYSHDYIMNMIHVLSAVFIISGIFSLITGILIYLRKLYIVALIACIVATIAVIWIVIGVFGFIVMYFIYKSKPEFAS